jgi:hypothetical protein
VRGFERRRVAAVERLGGSYAAGRLGEDSLEFRVGQALTATSDDGLRLALFGLPDAEDLARRARAFGDRVLGTTTALLIDGRPDLLLSPSAERQSWLIGRASDCDIQPVAISVSRRHARVDVRGGCWTVTDLDSANGTFVNGVRVSRAALRPRDVVHFAAVSAELQRRR